MLQQPVPEDAELRLALGMRGGVSLAVWIGGACAEIDELRRAADEQQGFWWEVLEASPYRRVTVDVMAGASAGGLNGILFAAAIRHGFRMDQLLSIWKDVADVGILQRKEQPWTSLFDGDARFLDVVRERLTDLIEGVADETRWAAHAGYVDLQLSATLVEPVESPAISPGDEKLRRSRASARFHFRHDPAAVPARRDIEPGDIARLAVAARATSSFPIAFEGAIVRATRPDAFELRRSSVATGAEGPNEDRELARMAARLADCRGVFSESRGPAKAPTVPFDDEDFVVADGGAVDNIPLSKALDGIRHASASGPTSRVLVYLHPTGPAGLAAAMPSVGPADTPEQRRVRRRNQVSVLRGLLASKVQSESIDGDLERLEAHNRMVRLGHLLRQNLLAELVEHARAAAAAATDQPAAPSPSELARSRLRGYLAQRAGADADDIRRLLADPLETLGEDPFPVPPARDDRPARHEDGEDRWRSPIAGWSSDQRLRLDTALRTQFAGALADRQLGIDILAGGLGPISRSIDLILELARAGERQGQQCAAVIGPLKPALYRLASFVRELGRLRQLAWVCRADHLAEGGDVNGWVDDTRTQVRRMIACDAAAVADLDATDPGRFAEAAHEVLQANVADLQAIACGEQLPEPGPGDKDLRRALVNLLQQLAAPILAALPPLPAEPLNAERPGERSGAEVIQRVLQDDSADSWDIRLAALEVLLVDEHLLGAPGHGEIGFARMSAAAPIIDAARFRKLHAYSKDLNEPFTSDGHHLAPDVKLAGNELASFSAFLDVRWRVNDWTWGRLDATATLVDLLLGEDRSDRDALRLDYARLLEVAGPEAQLRADAGSGDADERSRARRALTARRQQELLDAAVADGLPEDLGAWRAGLETLTHPGATELSRAVTELGGVAADVIGGVLPPQVPRLVGPLRRVLRSVAKRFAKPTGVLPEPVRRALQAAGVPHATPAARAGVPWVLAVVSVLVGAALAALSYGAADQGVSLAIGLVVGLAVGLVPGAILLWLAMRPDRGWPWYATAVAVGVLLGAGLAAVIVAALTAVL